MSQVWILYGTVGCHLCDEAAHVLRQAGLSFIGVDICDDPVLREKFGLMIPVLSHNTGHEPYLVWPFDLEQLQQWLSLQFEA